MQGAGLVEHPLLCPHLLEDRMDAAGGQAPPIGVQGSRGPGEGRQHIGAADAAGACRDEGAGTGRSDLILEPKAHGIDDRLLGGSFLGLLIDLTRSGRERAHADDVGAPADAGLVHEPAGSELEIMARRAHRRDEHLAVKHDGEGGFDGDCIAALVPGRPDDLGNRPSSRGDAHQPPTRRARQPGHRPGRSARSTAPSAGPAWS